MVEATLPTRGPITIGEPVIVDIDPQCETCNGQLDEFENCARCGRDPERCKCEVLPETPLVFCKKVGEDWVATEGVNI